MDVDNNLLEELEREIENENSKMMDEDDSAKLQNKYADNDNTPMNLETYLDEELKRIQNVEEVAKLLRSQRLHHIVSEIDKYSHERTMNGYFDNNLERHPEYKLILQANDMFVDIENEIMVIYRFTKQHYGKRFAELEKIVPNVLDYVRVVKAIGNHTDVSNIHLDEIVATTTVMVITMTASTSVELELPSDELQQVFNACDMILELEEIRKKVRCFKPVRINTVLLTRYNLFVCSFQISYSHMLRARWHL
jgi:U4/U6 small nuclear ribonucleoprotein PRP31